MKIAALISTCAIGLVIAGSSADAAECNCGVPPGPAGMVGGPIPLADGVEYGNYSGHSNFGASSYYGSPGGYGGSAVMGSANGPHWAPGGYEARVGSPVMYHDPAGGQYTVTGDPYYDHFGPGFHRHSLHGHYRFPYYNYRAPWYFPGRAVYNRNTNFVW